MQQENVSTVLLIRHSKGKVKGDWRNYGLWEAGQSDSEPGRGEIDGYEIMEGCEPLEGTGRLILPNPACPRLLSLALLNGSYYEGNFLALKHSVWRH